MLTQCYLKMYYISSYEQNHIGLLPNATKLLVGYCTSSFLVLDLQYIVITIRLPPHALHGCSHRPYTRTLFYAKR